MSKILNATEIARIVGIDNRAVRNVLMSQNGEFSTNISNKDLSKIQGIIANTAANQIQKLQEKINTRQEVETQNCKEFKLTLTLSDDKHKELFISAKDHRSARKIAAAYVWPFKIIKSITDPL